MALDPKTCAELERRGVSNVRALLQNPNAAGRGQNALVLLDQHGVPDPIRADAEAWLREQERAADALATNRHTEQLAVARAGVDWARKAYWAALGSIAVGIVGITVAVIFGVLSLAHGS